MLKQRLISKILLESGVAVKYRRFTESRRVVGDPVSVMRVLSDQTLDEFLICDLGVINPALVATMTDVVHTPVTAAGSLRGIDQVAELIRNCGVDKVVIRDDALGWKVAERFGRQAVVYPYDYHGDAPFFQPPEWAGEVLLTSIDRDGVGGGMDLGAIRFPYEIPVVLAGGCGKLAHVKEALAAGADGVCVSSMWAFTDKSPIKTRSWLVSEGCNVRGG